MVDQSEVGNLYKIPGSGCDCIFIVTDISTGKVSMINLIPGKACATEGAEVGERGISSSHREFQDYYKKLV